VTASAQVPSRLAYQLLDSSAAKRPSSAAIILVRASVVDSAPRPPASLRVIHARLRFHRPRPLRMQTTWHGSNYAPLWRAPGNLVDLRENTAGVLQYPNNTHSWPVKYNVVLLFSAVKVERESSVNG
jgi:hypothetical protein